MNYNYRIDATDMAGVVDRIRRKNRLQQPQKDWTSTGSFMSKPSRGWLHPDEQLYPDAGVCYGVRVRGINKDLKCYLCM